MIVASTGYTRAMARKGGWRRAGSKRRFRYLDSAGRQITDPAKIERIESLVIPPAWKDVWISPRANAKLQATGVDAAGRRQYLYHPEFRAQQEQAKFDKLVRFAEALPMLRQTMGEHMMLEPYDCDRICAVAVRLINLAWFRVGSDRYAKTSRTHGVTTLKRSHVSVRGNRVTFKFRAKHRVQVRTTLVDTELADAIKDLLEQPGPARLFRYGRNGESCNLTGAVLNAYIQEHMGEEFTEGLPDVGRDADGRGRARRARGRRNRGGGEADARKRDADGRRAARKHRGRCALVLREPGGRRAVSRGDNARRFPSAPFAHRQGTRYRSRPGGEGARQLVAFVANQTLSPGRVN